MYLGSVRFFKHLIVTVVILIIAGLSSAVVMLAFSNHDKSEEIERLQFDKNTLQALYNHSGGEINEILKILDALGIDPRDLVNTMYETNPEAFDDITGISGPSDTQAADEFSAPPIPVPNDIESEEIIKKPESPYAELYPHLYSDYTPPPSYIDDTGYIYLTFDDGPSVYTTDILRYLNKHSVPATFFVMPDDTENSKNFLNTMLDAGHEIGVHCMSHVYTDIYASVEAYLEDFNQAFNLVYEQTGYKPYLFRFPGGSKNDYNGAVRDDIIAEMTRRGFVYYDWNVDSRDAMDANWTQMYNTVLSEVANVPRAVILFHDRPGGYNTVTVIEDIIKALLDDPAGYTFSTITRETNPIQF